MTRKKILFVMQMPPPVHGVSIMNELISKSRLINSEFDCDYINLATAKSIDDLQKNRFLKYLTFVSIGIKTIWKLATRRYDYVYVTVFPYGFSFIKDSLIVLLGKLFRVKNILHLHTYGFKKGSGRSATMKRYYDLVFKNTHVICLSDLLIEDIEHIYKDNVFILPNGIPKVNFKNTYKNHQTPINILYLSNLMKGKGILLLIDAIEILKKQDHLCLLRIVGAEHDITFDSLKHLIAEKKLENEITLLGPKFGDEKLEEFRNAGLFVLPSDYDTFGLVLLEAMQFGIPCISTNIGGIPDVLGGGRGLIIPEITPQEIASAIAELISRPDQREAMSNLSFNYFDANFSSTVFEQRLADIFSGKPGNINTRLRQVKK